MGACGKIFFNALICDGSGEREVFHGWTAVAPGGIIEAVGAGEPPRCYRGYTAVDAGGLSLSPGFIDLHSHSDISIFAAGGRNTKSASGITAEVVGNCGLSAFPVTEKNREHLEALWKSYGVPLVWKDCKGYQEALKRAGVKMRIFPHLGHNTLRSAVGGYSRKKLSCDEISCMHSLAAEAFRQGACGFSTGLLYVPGKFADTQEIAELLRTLKEFSPVYVTHLRSEGAKLIEAVKEAVEICTAGELSRLHISHFKTAGAANYGKLDETLKILREAPLQVTCDAYPYTESLTQLSVVLPDQWEDMPDREITERLQDKGTASRLVSRLAETLSRERLESIRIAAVPPGFEDFRGRRLAEISENSIPAAAEIIIRLLAADSALALASFNSISQENMEKILSLDFCSPATDENARAFDGSTGTGHPRGAGTAAEFLQMMNKKGVPLHRAVWKLTGLAARIFSLPGVGTLAAGNHADIILWDPERFAAKADFADPLAPPAGIHAVYSGGEEI